MADAANILNPAAADADKTPPPSDTEGVNAVGDWDERDLTTRGLSWLLPILIENDLTSPALLGTCSDDDLRALLSGYPIGKVAALVLFAGVCRRSTAKTSPRAGASADVCKDTPGGRAGPADFRDLMAAARASTMPAALAQQAVNSLAAHGQGPLTGENVPTNPASLSALLADAVVGDIDINNLPPAKLIRELTAARAAGTLPALGDLKQAWPAACAPADQASGSIQLAPGISLQQSTPGRADREITSIVDLVTCVTALTTALVATGRFNRCAALAFGKVAPRWGNRALPRWERAPDAGTPRLTGRAGQVGT